MIFEDVMFVNGGWFTSKGSWKHPTLTIDTGELIYMLRGQAYLFEGNNEITARKGDAVFFSSGIPHGGRLESDNVSFIWLHFKGNAELPLKFTVPQTSTLPVLCRQLLHYSELTARYPRQMCDMLMRMILIESGTQLGLIRPEADRIAERRGRLPVNGDITTERLINGILEWIRINPDKNLTVRSIAGHFQYNEEYLTRLFRKHTGFRLKEYITETRMNAIRNRLLLTEEPLKAIAAGTGFDDCKSFLKYFAYHEGISPTKYRELYYKAHTNNR